jgi:hypothetical protein
MEEIIRYLILGSLAAIAWRDAEKSQDKTRGINHVAAQISTGYLPNKSAWQYSQCHIASFDHILLNLISPERLIFTLDQVYTSQSSSMQFFPSSLLSLLYFEHSRGMLLPYVNRSK